MEIRSGGDDTIELYNASARGCTTTLNLLIHKDSHILNKVSLSSFSETPLHVSALLGHFDFTRALLDLKPEWAAKLDSQKRCPLHLASAEGHIKIIQSLLNENNDTCIVQDQDGRIPLHYAAMRGQIEVMRELISAGPKSTKVMVNKVETVMHLCVKYNQLDALKLLVDSLSNEDSLINSQDHDGGNTILHLAVMLKQTEMVEYLLSVPKVKEGSDIQNRIGLTALEVLEHCSKDFKSFNIQKMLMNASVERAKNQNILSPTAMSSHPKSTTPARSSKKRLDKLLSYLGFHVDMIDETRGALMVVATVITSITFQSGVGGPPDLYSNFAAYIFFTSNTISFTASVSVIFLLISGFPLKNKVCMGILSFSMGITLIFLVAAYVSASPFKEGVGIPIGLSVLFVVAGAILLIYVIRLFMWLARTRCIRKFISTCGMR
ncbi:ankyrin repeat-containing protein BDA1-like [Quercus lobata]|nr:ankyrin repeat-containing protein BDA1-like [Quercus lobata]